MTPVDTAVAQTQRVLLVAALAFPAVLYGPVGGVDGGTVVKTLAITLAALAAVAVTVVAAVRARQAELPASVPAVLAGLLAVALLTRALLDDRTALALTGPLGRSNGVGLAAAVIALFAVAALRSDRHTWSLVAGVLTVTGLLVGLSAIDEATLRLGPNWAPRPGAAGTMGNANFLSAWSAAVVPMAVMLVADRRRAAVVRVGASITIVVLLAAIVLSGSIQGGYTLAAGAATLLLVWTSERLRPVRWRALAAATAVAGVAAGVATFLGATGRGPLSPLRQQIGVRLREEYWLAGARMVQERPWAGVGPAGYLDHFRRVRSPDGAALVSLNSTSDSAHNVPLHLAAEHGLPLAVVYGVFCATVLWALVRAVRRHRGLERRWVGVLGAVYISYLAQSIISIDVPQLAVLGWVSAGLIVGAAWPPTRLGPGRPRPRSSKQRRAAARWSAPEIGVAVAVTALMVVGAAVASLPYRADAAVGELRELGGSRPSSGAIERAPWHAGYHVRLATELIEGDEREAAAEVLDRAVEVAPRSFDANLNRARVARALGDDLTAATRYERLTDLDPHHPRLLYEVAVFRIEAGEVDAARELLLRAAEVDPDDEDVAGLLEQLG